MKKLKCIMLVDDSEPTNFLNERVIKKLECADKVITMQNGSMALEYIKSLDSAEQPKPDLILLDINMPVMNGWEFLEEYNKLEESLKKCVIVVMLTTSLNPADQEKANRISAISDYMSKPLSPDKMKTILEKHFPE